MADVFTKQKRSEVMARIRSRGNRDTELALAKWLRAHGITGWRRNQRVFGRPDFVFRRVRVALFADGCFWHGCPVHGTRPRTNAAFWRKKIARNRERDGEVTRFLRKNGWRVLRVWEHELARKIERRLAARIRRAVAG
jgi:DNA mismatch endonuclease (patch repair protein)